MVQDTKLYDILEIKSDATDDIIKKAYRKLSFKWHPDKNQDNQEIATEKFKEISEAYTILSDPEQRASYDRDGYDSLKNPQGGQHFNPNDIFEQFFGNFGGQGFPGQGFPGQGFPGQGFGQRQEHCMVEKEVGLDEIFSMKTISVTYKQKIYCKKCNGNGTKDGASSKCTSCGGAGKKVQVMQRGNMVQQMVVPCNDCGGRGERVSKNNACQDCNGEKIQIKEKSVDIPLTKNLSNGDKMVVEGKGHILKTGSTNLIVVIKEKPHDLFKRHGKDLHINMKLRLFQTLYGFTKTIHHLDGRQLLLQYKAMNKMATMIRIKNEGMTGGDLVIHVTTSIPNLEKLEENEKNILKKILVKTNQTEFNKELNLIKTHPNHVVIQPTNIIEIDSDDDDEETFEGGGNAIPGMGMPPGVQCAQQ
jgi:DnaJ family protein A protein 2